MHDRLTHHEVVMRINDAVEEATTDHMHTIWKQENDFSWIVEDDCGCWIGRVNAKVNTQTGLVTFKYKHNRNTFSGINKIPPVSVDPASATDEEELAKIRELDQLISNAHNLGHEEMH